MMYATCHIVCGKRISLTIAIYITLDQTCPKAGTLTLAEECRRRGHKPLSVLVLSCSKPQNAFVPPFSEHPHNVSEYRTYLHNSDSRRSSHAWFAQSLVLWLLSMHTKFGILAIQPA